MPDTKDTTLNEARQDVISILFGLIDDQKLHVDEPDVARLDEVVSFVFAKNNPKLTREEARQLVNEVWRKIVAWITEED